MVFWYTMPLDYFHSFAEAILILHQEAPQRVPYDEVEAWLGDAVTQAKEDVFGTWSVMLTLYISRTPAPNNVEVQALHLHRYFNALLAASQPTAIAMFASPGFESLLWRLNANPNAISPTFGALLESGWEPAALMERMRDLESRISAARSVGQRRVVPFENTGPGLFIKLLYPVFRAKVAFVPNPVYAMLLKTYGLGSGEQPSEEAKFLRNVLDLAPEELHAVLAFVEDYHWLQPAHVEGLFPLPLGVDNAPSVVQSLLLLMGKTQTHLKGSVQALLHEHHPEVEHLLSMHRDLYPDLAASLQAVDAVTEAFVGIAQRQAGHCVQPFVVPSNLFEESTGAQKY